MAERLDCAQAVCIIPYLPALNLEERTLARLPASRLAHQSRQRQGRRPPEEMMI